MHYNHNFYLTLFLYDITIKDILLFILYDFTVIFNHIFYTADDGGFEMRSYLNKICQAPNLDNLAKESLVFNNAYSSVSSCSPRYNFCLI